MEKKLKRNEEKHITEVMKDSSRQVWLAGLGAYEKAQKEGSKLFDSLVKQGEELETRTKKTAEDKTKEVKRKATKGWDKLEKVFEERVERALNRLGAPSRKDIQKLTRRVDELNESIQALPRGETKTPARHGGTKAEEAA